MTEHAGIRARLPLSVGADAGRIEALLHERLAAARARWPAISLGDAAFVEHLWPHDGARPRAPSVAGAVESLHLDDLFLACACLHGDRGALGVLEREVLERVPRWVARFHGVHGADVQQEIRQKLLLPPAPQLLTYNGTRSLERWVCVAASRCAIDLQRRLKPVDSGDPLEELLAGPDPELDFMKLRDREALRSILRDAFVALPEKARTLLRLHYLEGVSLEKLATLEQVHKATIKRHLVEARSSALTNVRKLLRERLRLSEAEGDSLLRLLRSRIDVSIRGAASLRREP